MGCVLGDGNRTGFDHIFVLSVAPIHADGGNMEGCSTLHIVMGIADHNDGFVRLDLIQQILDHFAFAVPGGVLAGTADQIEILGQVKMLQDMLGHMLRLGGGYINPAAVFFQGFEHMIQPRIYRVFQPTVCHIKFAVDPQRLFRVLRADAEADKAVPQGRANDDTKRLPVRDGQAVMGQGYLHAVHDTGTGVRNGAIQIE